MQAFRMSRTDQNGFKGYRILGRAARIRSNNVVEATAEEVESEINSM